MPAPYYAVAPGTAVDVGGLVSVSGAPSFPAEGRVYLTTVSLRRVTLVAALRGWLDPSVDVVPQDAILPPRSSPEDLRSFNLELMDDSKQAALGVAFEELGYDAIRGGGAEIVQVERGSPAAGVLEVGDVIVGVGGAPVAEHYEAVRALGRRLPGDAVELSLRSAGGAARTAVVVLGESPDRPGRPLLGVTLQTRDLSFELPFGVDIASERIGGSSAGLAFALEVLDMLTEGELTGGERVAATGTIELDGAVDDVGGVAQKTVAVRDAGIGLFLVPRRELEEARRFAGDSLRVEPVDTLADALDVLADAGGEGLAPGPLR